MEAEVRRIWTAGLASSKGAWKTTQNGWIAEVQGKMAWVPCASFQDIMAIWRDSYRYHLSDCVDLVGILLESYNFLLEFLFQTIFLKTYHHYDPHKNFLTPHTMGRRYREALYDTDLFRI